MRVRRCATLMLEPRESIEFSLSSIISGGAGLDRAIRWVALLPHEDAETAVDGRDFELLGTVSPTTWVELDELKARHPAAAVEALLAKRLLVAEGSESDERDRRLRGRHWRPASAVMHYASRWRSIGAADNKEDLTETLGGQLADWQGRPPPPIRERVEAGARQRLPRSPASPLETLMNARSTCREFDDTQELGHAYFSALLYRVFGARAVDEPAPGITLLKRNVPSAGGLHPTEAYLLVQRVEGVEPGLYHYHPLDHALEPIAPRSAEAAAALAMRFVSAQDYLANAHVLVALTSRFERTFWRYRNHSKAYRALILDIGHLSQMLYLTATELGLGAFVTAAVNEVDIERAFALDPYEEGPLAVCGFGVRTQPPHEGKQSTTLED